MKNINNLSLKEKISQMFIMGFSGTSLNAENNNIQNLAKNGLGGVILFAENIDSYNQVKKLSCELQSISKIPLFISIDQEGGLVERTIRIKNKLDYLTPMALSLTKSPELIKQHTLIMAEELKFMGINMNFSPVLDVNTNINNPIIGVRSFGNNTEDVINFSEPVYKTLTEKNIIPVGKHFPGHGETSVDSHIDMPVVDLSLEELEKTHIKPFKTAVDNGLDALMAAHVFYKAFNEEVTPASLSKEIITNYLKKDLNYKGLVISDDMAMGGIENHYKPLDACIKGINAGIDLFIFRDSKNEVFKLIDELVNSVEKGLISSERIDESVEKILFIKKKYKILSTTSSVNQLSKNNTFDTQIFQDKIDKIAVKSIQIEKKGNLIPLNTNKKYLILFPDKSAVFNLSKDKSTISDFLENINHKQIIYSLNPENEEIENIVNESKDFEAVIFVEYNSVFYKKQLELIKNIKIPVILINTGIPFILNNLINIDSLIKSCCIKKTSLKASVQKLFSL